MIDEHFVLKHIGGNAQKIQHATQASILLNSDLNLWCTVLFYTTSLVLRRYPWRYSINVSSQIIQILTSLFKQTVHSLQAWPSYTRANTGISQGLGLHFHTAMKAGMNPGMIPTTQQKRKMVGLETHYKWVPGMGKSSINGELSIAMFDYQPFVSHFLCVGTQHLL